MNQGQFRAGLAGEGAAVVRDQLTTMDGDLRGVDLDVELAIREVQAGDVLPAVAQLVEAGGPVNS